MTNPARVGLYETLQEMGADLTLSPAGVRAGEALVDLTVKSGVLKGVDVPAERAPSMIDEYPILSVIAAFAEGRTIMRGLAELRAKESDRLAASAAMLVANGVRIEMDADTLIVEGCGPDGPPGGGTVLTHHDHRLAMSGLVMGLGAREAVTVDDVSMIATSYPGFFDDFEVLGAVFEAGEAP
jgi:5-enolpyruvylshikimate-3-phosphate synthase